MWSWKIALRVEDQSFGPEEAVKGLAAGMSQVEVVAQRLIISVVFRFGAEEPLVIAPRVAR
jgi:hypothetical protein